jgi:hypothetical protein
MPVLKNLIGLRFNRLIVLSRAKNRKNVVYWLCKCDCGAQKEVAAQQLTCKNIKSCGCYTKEINKEQGKTLGKLPKKIKHGMIKSPEYYAWSNIKARCSVEIKRHQHKNYWGRGIVVCQRWLESFDNFYADMGQRPSSRHSIDRIDTNGNYEPGNCRWANATEQALNKRTNIYIEFNGEKRTITQWSKLLENGKANTIRERLNRGWSIEDALTKPCKRKKIAK